MSVNVAGRLERLPASRPYYAMIILISLGLFWDSYMLFTVGGIAAHFISVTGITSFAAYVPTFLFAGTFIGAITLTSLADNIGRRDAFVIDIALLVIGALIAFLATNAYVFGAGLFISGLGTGAEIPLSSTYAQELSPSSKRATTNLIVLTLGFLGGTVGGFADLFLIPLYSTAYRLVLLIAVVGGALTLLMRLYLPESPRWLESHGLYEKAERAISLIENRTMRSLGLSTLPQPPNVKEPITYKWDVKQLFKGEYKRRTLSAWLIEFFQGFGFYGFAAFVPSFIYSLGYSIVKALLYSAIIQVSYIIGPLISFSYVNRISRKSGMAILYLVNTLAGIGFLLSGVFKLGAFFIVLFGFLTELLVFMDGPLLHIYEVEIYPAYVRGSGSGISFSLSRLGGFLAPLIGGTLLIWGGKSGYIDVVVWATVAWLICSIVAATLAVSTKNESLEVLEK